MKAVSQCSSACPAAVDGRSPSACGAAERMEDRPGRRADMPVRPRSRRCGRHRKCAPCVLGISGARAHIPHRRRGHGRQPCADLTRRERRRLRPMRPKEGDRGSQARRRRWTCMARPHLKRHGGWQAAISRRTGHRWDDMRPASMRRVARGRAPPRVGLRQRLVNNSLPPKGIGLR